MTKALGYLGRTPCGDLYKCRYSGQLAVEKHMRFIAPIMPQCPASEAVHATLKQDVIKTERKASLQAFNEMDANCNACKHFVRMWADNKKGSNAASNFVYGNCSSQNGRPDLIGLKREGFQIMVHVADCMNMPCWESR